MSCLCVIPARGGSKRIHKKNIKPFLGKPILAYSIAAVKQSNIASELMVSTDDEDIARIAGDYGAKVPFLRSQENSDDKSGLADVLSEVIEQYDKQGESFDYVACILPTAPLIRAEDIRNAFDILTDNEEATSICSVEKFSYPPQRGLVMEEDYLIMIDDNYYYSRSQDLRPIYHDCGQFFIFRTEAFMKEKRMYTTRNLAYHISSRYSQDIDDETDWEIAEIKYKLMMEKGLL